MAANLALITKGLRVGDRDPVVIQVRQLLGKAGVLANYTVSDPALFDPGLGQLVRAFQKAQGLQQDGIVGVRTWSLLGGASVGTPATPETPPTQNDVPTQPAPPAGPGGASGFPFMLAAGALAAAAGLYWYSKRKSSSGPSSALSTLSGWLGGPVEDEAKRVQRNLKARARRHAKEREEELAATRAAWELAKRNPDIIGAQLEAETQRLVRAGFRPTDAAMRARAQLMSRSPGLSTQARIEATVRAEAARLTPTEGADKAERVNIERQRRALTEKMMRTGLGPMKNVTQATHTVRSVSPTRPAQEIFPQGVRAAIAPPIGGKLRGPTTITVDADAYASDKAYRESMKDRAKTTAIETGHPVHIIASRMQGSLVESTETRGARALYPSTFTPSMKVGSKDKNAGQASADARFPVRPSVRLDPNEHGASPSRTLWTYDPSKRKSMGRFRDVVTDSLLDEPAVLANDGDCEGAVKTLLKRRALPATPREAELQKRVITVVNNRCAPELERAVAVAANEREGIEAMFPGKLGPGEQAEERIRASSRRDARVRRDRTEDEIRAQKTGLPFRVSKKERSDPAMKKWLATQEVEGKVLRRSGPLTPEEVDEVWARAERAARQDESLKVARGKTGKARGRPKAVPKVEMTGDETLFELQEKLKRSRMPNVDPVVIPKTGEPYYLRKVPGRKKPRREPTQDPRS